MWKTLRDVVYETRQENQPSKAKPIKTERNLW